MLSRSMLFSSSALAGSEDLCEIDWRGHDSARR